MSKLIEPLERRTLLSGELDTSFGSGGVGGRPLQDSHYTRVAPAADGSIYAVGIGFDDRQFVHRYTATGVPDYDFGEFDTQFRSDPTMTTAMAVRADGDVFVGGAIGGGAIGGGDSTYRQVAVLALKPDGTPDYAWGSGGIWYGWAGDNAEVTGLTFGGSTLYVGGTDGQSLLTGRFTAAGTLDSSFGTDGTGLKSFAPPGFTVYGGTMRGSDLQVVHRAGYADRLLLGGSFVDANTGYRRALATESTLDGTAGSGLTTVTATAGQPNDDFNVTHVAADGLGRVLIAGDTVGRATIQRITPDGSTDFTFGTGGLYSAPTLSETTVTSLATLRQGEVVYSGPGGSGSATAGDYVYALTAAGTPNVNFSPETAGYPNEPRGTNNGLLVTPPAGHFFDAAVQGDGKIVFAGGNEPGLGSFSAVQLLRLSVQTNAPATTPVTGRTYSDANRNGVYDAGDTLLGGRLVYDDVNGDNKFNAGEPSATSTTAGTYTLTLPGGQHDLKLSLTGAVRNSPEGGLVFTTPTPASYGPLASYDVGQVIQGTLQVSVYLDANQNGVKDAGEGFPADSQQTWIDKNNDGIYNEVPSIATSGVATYTLDPGTYAVRWLPRNGYRQTAPAAGAATPGTVVAGGTSSVFIGITNAPATTGIITGKVFNDLNGDGVKSAAEGEYDGYGISAYLDLNNDGAFTSGEPSSYTGGSGTFSFANLAPGNYTVRLFISSGLRAQQTAPSAGGGVTVAVAAGQALYVGGLGVRESFYVSGRSFDDADGDGVYQSTETLQAGRTVYADLNDNAALDAGEPSASTNTKGVYSLYLPTATYRLREVVPAGSRETGRSVTANVAATGNTFAADGRVRVADDLASLSSTSPSFDFGTHALTRVAGFVVHDTNGNGVADAGEPALTPGDVVYVDADNDGTLDNGELGFTTNVDGWYFSLAPGTYTIRQQLPGGVLQTAPAGGGGFVVTVTGTETNTIRPGNFLQYTPPAAPKGSIAGTVFDDLNFNEEFDTYEAGTVGRTVVLEAVHPGAANTVVATMTTAADGSFKFTGVAAGQYQVRAVVPAGFTSTAPVGPLPVTLANGDAVTGLQFGQADARFATVTGTLFYDANRDGLFNEGDYGLDGDVYVDTNGNGYSDGGDPFIAFSDRAGGRYSLKLPATGGTYTLIYDNAGSGLAATTPTRVTLTPTPGTGYTLNFGQGPLATANTLAVSGVVYVDANKNYKRDPGEPGVSLAQVYVDTNANGRLDDGESATYTNAAGAYAFLVLPATGKSATVRVVLPAGYTLKYPSSNGGYAVTLAAKAKLANLDFGLVAAAVPTPVSVTGTIYLDANQNGKKDTTEAGIGGVTVFADLDNDGVLDANEARAVTTGAGAYTLSVPAGGSAVVRAVAPAGDAQKTPTANGGYAVTLTAGAKLTAKDFGFYKSATPPPVTPPVPPPVTPPAGNTASISGLAFGDTNRNGVYDGGDVVAAGRTVWIDLDDDGVIDANEQSVVTDAAGKFTFKNLAAGRYHVRRVFPSGYVESSPARYVTVTAGQAASGVNVGSRAK